MKLIFDLFNQREMSCPQGAIIHWGIYSVPAYDNITVARRRRLKNGSEWYLQLLIDKGTWRPMSGHEQVKNYHVNQFNNASYDNFLIEFNKQSAEWDPQMWFTFFENQGIEYAILTAKHHDGICLWDTATTERKTQRDLIGDFIACGRKNNIKVGIYYSWFEFQKPLTIPYLDNVVVKQIEELRSYDPDIFWFDGDWKLTSKRSKDTALRVVKDMKKDGILVNSRIGENAEGLGAASFKTFGDREMPDKYPGFPWEYIFTIGLSWGLNLQQEKSDYKSGEEIYNLYKETCERKGSFLINFGPHPNGDLDKNEVESIESFTRIRRFEEMEAAHARFEKIKVGSFDECLDEMSKMYNLDRDELLIIVSEKSPFIGLREWYLSRKKD